MAATFSRVMRRRRIGNVSHHGRVPSSSWPARHDGAVPDGGEQDEQREEVGVEVDVQPSRW